MLDKYIAAHLPLMRYKLLEESAFCDKTLAAPVLFVDSRLSPSRVDLEPVTVALERLQVIASHHTSPAATQHMQTAKAHLLAYRAKWAPAAGSETAAVCWPESGPAISVTSLRVVWTANALPLGALAEEVTRVRAMAAEERDAYLARLHAELDITELSDRLEGAMGLY